MAKLLLSNGVIQEVSPLNPAEGFELEELYNLLECRIVEVVSLSDGRIMIVDEEGKLIENAVNNQNATELFQPGRMTTTEQMAKLKKEYGASFIDISEDNEGIDLDSIYGHAIVCDPTEFN